MKRTILITVFICLFCLTSNSWATTYYVDADAGSGGDGSIGDPWDSPSDVSRASPGDTVYFDSTDTWTCSSGSCLQMEGGVTYIGNEWPSADSDCTDGGCAKLDRDSGSGDYGALVRMSVTHATYQTILQGFEIDGNSRDCDALTMESTPTTGDLHGATKIIRDNYMHHFGVPGATSSWSYGIVIQADAGGWNGIDPTDITDVHILNNTVSYTGSCGICNYNDNQGDRSDLIDDWLVTTHDILIRGNEVYGAGTRGAGTWGVGIYVKNWAIDTIVEFNYSHDNTLSGVEVTTDDEGEGHRAPENVHIRYNILEGNNRGVMVYGRQDTDVKIYGNLIFNNSAHGIWIYDAEPGKDFAAYIYNNSFFNNGTNSTSHYGCVKKDGATGMNIIAMEYKNNVCSFTTGRGILDSGNQFTHTNNVYYTTGTHNIAWLNGGTYNCSEIANGDAGATEDCYDPNFKNTSNLPTGITGTHGTDMLPNADGLSVESGNVIDGGATLVSAYNGAINLSGTNSVDDRNDYLPWDIGAYELLNQSSKPEAPTGLRIIP